MFVERGFHATSLDVIADAAGYTKGAVYSNFDSKEDLFFAVYERRVQRGIAAIEAALDREPAIADAFASIARGGAARRGRDDGWLAVFYEFWAHVLRHPEHRARFAALHARVQAPLAAATARLPVAGLPVSSRELSTAMYAMQSGLLLERLTQPDVVDVTLAERMARLTVHQLEVLEQDEEEGGSDGRDLP